MPFLQFVRDHATALDAVHDREGLAAWHAGFVRGWGASPRTLADAANATLRLSGDHAIRDEVGYLVAERRTLRAPRRHRWVLLSANPGWNQVTNVTERSRKGQDAEVGFVDLETYEAFRTHFFPRWYDEVMRPAGPSRAMWWNRALSFLHRVAGLQKPPQMAAIHADLDLMGWELWPFHSTRDGLSAAAASSVELDAFADASIRAACRVESDGVLVASKAGAERVLRLVGSEFSAIDEVVLPNGPRAVRLRHDATGRRVVVIARQLFAGRSLPRAVMQALAEFSRGEATSAPRAAEVPASAVAPVGDDIPVEGPIRLVPDPGTGTLLVVVHVCGQQGSLDALTEDAEEEEVHARVGGYWVTAGSGGRAAEVQAALRGGRQVLVVGMDRGLVIRVLKVIAGEDFPMPREFIHGEGRLFHRWAHQPRWVDYPGRPGQRFGTAYVEVGVAAGRSEVRVRYHTRSFDDGAWVGRRLDTGAGAIPRTAPLYSTIAPLE